MPLFRKKRSDVSDGSSLSHSSTFSLGRLGSKKRQNNNDNDNVDPNKVAVVPNKAKKLNNSSSKMAAVTSHNDEETVCSKKRQNANKLAVVPNKAKKINNNSSKKAVVASYNDEETILAGRPRKISSYPSEGRHVPLSLRLSADAQDRSYGSSDVSLNTAGVSTVAVEKYGRCSSPFSTPLKPATSIENQVYNLSAITDDILTAAVRICYIYSNHDILL